MTVLKMNIFLILFVSSLIIVIESQLNDEDQDHDTAGQDFVGSKFVPFKNQANAKQSLNKYYRDLLEYVKEAEVKTHIFLQWSKPKNIDTSELITSIHEYKKTAENNAKLFGNAIEWIHMRVPFIKTKFKSQIDQLNLIKEDLQNTQDILNEIIEKTVEKVNEIKKIWEENLDTFENPRNIDSLKSLITSFIDIGVYGDPWIKSSEKAIERLILLTRNKVSVENVKTMVSDSCSGSKSIDVINSKQPINN